MEGNFGGGKFGQFTTKSICKIKFCKFVQLGTIDSIYIGTKRQPKQDSIPLVHMYVRRHLYKRCS